MTNLSNPCKVPAQHMQSIAISRKGEGGGGGGTQLKEVNRNKLPYGEPSQHYGLRERGRLRLVGVGCGTCLRQTGLLPHNAATRKRESSSSAGSLATSPPTPPGPAVGTSPPDLVGVEVPSIPFSLSVASALQLGPLPGDTPGELRGLWRIE